MYGNPSQKFLLLNTFRIYYLILLEKERLPRINKNEIVNDLVSCVVVEIVTLALVRRRLRIVFTLVVIEARQTPAWSLRSSSKALC